MGKRASDVITQTNSDKQNEMVEDLALFQARKQVFLKQFLKRRRLFSSCFSQKTPMLSDSRAVPIICILFLYVAPFVILRNEICWLETAFHFTL